MTKKKKRMNFDDDSLGFLELSEESVKNLQAAEIRGEMERNGVTPGIIPELLSGKLPHPIDSMYLLKHANEDECPAATQDDAPESKGKQLPLESERIAKEFKRESWDSLISAAFEASAMLKDLQGGSLGVLCNMYYRNGIAFKEKMLKSPEDCAEAIKTLLVHKITEYETLSQLETVKLIGESEGGFKQGKYYKTMLETKIMLDKEVVSLVDLLHKIENPAIKLMAKQINMAHLQQIKK